MNLHVCSTHSLNLAYWNMMMIQINMKDRNVACSLVCFDIQQHFLFPFFLTLIYWQCAKALIRSYRPVATIVRDQGQVLYTYTNQTNWSNNNVVLRTRNQQMYLWQNSTRVYIMINNQSSISWANYLYV